ncbi:MAG: hypothetical protein ACLTLQ_09735 [[Clostridium] scindens]
MNIIKAETIFKNLVNLIAIWRCKEKSLAAKIIIFKRFLLGQPMIRGINYNESLYFSTPDGKSHCPKVEIQMMATSMLSFLSPRPVPENNLLLRICNVGTDFAMLANDWEKHIFGIISGLKRDG